jgi:hypothetical protein
MSGRLPDIDGKSWANTELVFAQEVEMTNGGARGRAPASSLFARHVPTSVPARTGRIILPGLQPFHF